ncbi:ABC transporter permease subunit [Anaerocolumna sp. AGMB13025]|uniref:ABC transporter permease n=1 Tax=Anaerocolumna sp. AGMB13025 TaxID=3039116 RepID=UPI00241DEA3A|nr:ABC transporter permease subunit [Anaerocolumna sp. AGMB13025]WFR58573.1 ABC transporter permease subunit [Anaerocolumna sp. AGMB13025]
MNQFSGLKRSYQKNKRYKQLYLLALIPFLFVLIFNYIPMSGILLAFKDYSIRKGIMGSPWAGLKYFRQLFSIPIFPTILKNTIVLSLESMLFSFPFPIILALAFNEIRNAKLKKVFQTITFAPYFISTVVIVSIIFQMFSYRYGVINSFVNALGFESVNFTGLSGFFKPSYIISGIWQGAGYSSILYIAALASVDLSLYEAAAIDGASRFQKVLHVDLPCITPTIVITLILSAGNILSIGFEKVYLLQNPANYNVSEIIATYVYKTGIEQAQFSFSTAVGLFNAVVNCIMLLIVNMIANKVSETSLF